MLSGRASSGRKADASDSPQLKKRLDSTMSATASATSPGPTSDSAAVETTQAAVDSSSSGFLAARRSAQAPSAGMLSITSRLEAASVAVQASVAQGAPPATPPTK
jgi:hypothetical protein